ncbi:MAG: hypothetical protein FJ387_15820 [Verrucomicrobia bacterium]|nr:hypothetical protein [Verrucomicrobiota bacterium]
MMVKPQPHESQGRFASDWQSIVRRSRRETTPLTLKSPEEVVARLLRPVSLTSATSFSVSATKANHAQRTVAWMCSARDVHEGMPAEVTLKPEELLLTHRRI